MTIAEFNSLNDLTAADKLSLCCGSRKWQELMINAMPFEDERHLLQFAADAWYNKCTSPDWLEAFDHHPQIGDKEKLKTKFAATGHLAGEEQSGVNDSAEDILEKLALFNREYERKFGFIFIICATGKSASEMLYALNMRLNNNAGEEILVAMGEQHKITVLRLRKLLHEANWDTLPASHITTHVLNTTLGKPGRNISIRLQRNTHTQWETFAHGITNEDGRLSDILPLMKKLEAGNYKLVFETAEYFASLKAESFYPQVEIQFTITSDVHYHVPLLLNPFGYATYRGS